MRKSLAFSVAAGLLAGLITIGCGGSQNPAAPQVAAPPAAAGGDGAASASSRLPEGDAATSVQSWSIQDACSDGKGIRSRLWEAINLRLTGRYTRIFSTRSNLGTVRFRLLCVRGTSGCMGATTNPPSATIWGVGLNAERRPAKAFCKPCSGTAVNLRLLCARRLDGGFDSQLVEDEFGEDPAGDVAGSSLDDEGLASFDAVE
jgi:hypothetical protein